MNGIFIASLSNTDLGMANNFAKSFTKERAMTFKNGKKIRNWCVLLTISVFFIFFSANVFADVTIDDGDAGTSYTGTWSRSGGTLPYNGDSLWARNGATYTWQFDSEPAGTYEVLMWWSAWQSRATDISVDINYTGGTETQSINQQEGAGDWNSVGTYYFDSSGSVTITAADGSTVSTCADAVWFRFISSNTPPTASIDMIDPNPAEPSQFIEFSGSGTDSEGSVVAYQWESSIDGLLSDLAVFTTSSLTEGTHTISFRVQDNEGLWSPQVTQILIVGTIPTEIIIDNRDPQTSQIGTWRTSGASDPYGADSVWSRDGTTFTWNFNPPRTGDYEVSIWWTEWSSRSTSVPVTINFEGDSETVAVNQQQDGGHWNSLGIFHFDVNSSGSVSITSQPSPSSTCADAVRFNFVQTNDPPTAFIDSITPNPADAGEEVTFIGNGEDNDGTVVAYSWVSSIDGPLSDAPSFSTASLSEGIHTITFRVQDNENEWSTPATETLIVGNSPPLAFIDSITPNPAELEDDITFSGHGEDQDGTVTNYRWESSLSGNLSDQATFIRTASSLGQGLHTISFNVMDDDGEWSPVITQTLAIGNIPPNAYIDFVAPNPANIGETVSFEGHGEDSDGTITGYRWESSIDGHLSDLASFSVSSLSRANHTITFRVYDDEGAVSEPVIQVLIVDEIPIEVEIDNGGSGTSYTGTWSVSGGSDPFGSNSLWSRDGATYTWTFTPEVASYYETFMWWTEWSSRSSNVPVDIEYEGGSTTVYINQQENGGQWNSLGEYYFEAGSSYNLTVTAQPGPSSTCVDAVKFVRIIEPSPPVADFSADATYGGAPYLVQFTDTSLGIVTEWFWDFGDEQTSTQQYPLHEYTSPGVYTVSLTVTNSSGSDTKTRENYINIVADSENIYLCDGYSHDALFIPQTIQMLQDLGAVENSGVWIYTNTDKNITYFIHTVRTPEDMEEALKEEGAHVIFNGHSNFGFGATFATIEEVGAQQIDDIYYIDDDRFTNFSTDMVSTKIDGMKYGQAYPNWEPFFKDGTSGIMPYDFTEGIPPYNYYLSYEVSGDSTVYKMKLSDGSYLERFPDSNTPAWFSIDGSTPDPVLNSEYFIINNEVDYNRCDFVGNWPIAKVPGAGFMGDAGYLGYNYQYSLPGTGENIATFNMVVKTPGYYAVMASWFPDSSNATNAKFTIQHSGGKTTVEADQRTTELMNLLGVFQFDTGNYSIVLNNDADGNVIGDALIFKYTSDPATILQAEFDADTKSGGVPPFSVQFEDLSSVYIDGDFGAEITNWHWNFGDGTTSIAQNAAHIYSEPGIFTVSLRVTDSSGAEHTEVKEGFIAVDTNESLKAEFTAPSRMGSERTIVSFVDQSTGNIMEWHWNFGDGVTSNEQNPIHLYSIPGSYTVTLTVNGPQDSDSETEVDFVNNIVGTLYVDNTFHTKPHFYSGSMVKFGKVVINTGDVKIPEEELQYSRLYYSSCNSCNYYAGTFHRGIMFCTTGDSVVYTADDYLEAYLLGYTDEEILVLMNSIQPIHEYLDFNQPPPSMR